MINEKRQLKFLYVYVIYTYCCECIKTFSSIDGGKKTTGQQTAAELWIEI